MLGTVAMFSDTCSFFCVYDIYYAPRILGFTFFIQLVDALIMPLMTRMLIDVFGESFNVYQYICIGSIEVAVFASLAAFLSIENKINDDMIIVRLKMICGRRSVYCCRACPSDCGN